MATNMASDDWTKGRVKLGVRIVAAATKVGDVILVGVRHGDPFMSQQIDKIWGSTEAFIKYRKEHGEVQGFIDNAYRFVDRQEGLEIAKKQRQIRKKHGLESELYSEDLY